MPPPPSNSGRHWVWFLIRWYTVRKLDTRPCFFVQKMISKTPLKTGFCLVWGGLYRHMESVKICWRHILFFFSFFRFEWDKLLENVHCLIISVTKSDKQEAYILRWVLAVFWQHISVSLWLAGRLDSGDPSASWNWQRCLCRRCCGGAMATCVTNVQDWHKPP